MMKTTIDPSSPPQDVAATANPANAQMTATVVAPHIERPTKKLVQPATMPAVEGYVVTELLGEGGMGSVWRATQLSTHREVALKLLGSRLFISDRTRARFDREVELTAKLEHPNIARIYDSGVDKGIYYYAMELLDGVELDKYVQAKELTLGQTMDLMRRVCLAVQHAHEKGVIHRDLKPSNIMVTEDGEPHVLDFGLAKAIEGGGDVAMTMEGEVAGTPAFMSPEQAMGRIDMLDTRTDVYSLGVTLYCLVVGQPPHDLSGGSHTVIRRIHDEDARRPRDLSRRVDRELEALLLKALARDPKARYASAGELARDITNYLNHDPLVAKPPTLNYFIRKRIRKHRTPIGIVAGTLGSLLLGGSVWGWIQYHKVVTVPVNTDPPGAVVFVNGEEHSCGTPCFAFVGPGRHTITVRHPGDYLPATRVVEVAWGRAKFSTEEPIAMTPNYQFVTFNSSPSGADFELTERDSGKTVFLATTPFQTRVAVGSYRARFTKPGYIDDAAATSIEITGSREGGSISRDLRPESTPLE